MRIELLVTPDCPHAEQAEGILRRALTQDGPWLIAVRIDDKPGVGATDRDPVVITDRFMRGIGSKK